MKKLEPPQIYSKLIPLLELDMIEKGTRIHRKNDQREVHWQLTTFIIKGIDPKKEVILATELSGERVIIPFEELDQYYVNTLANPKKS